jgi:hypothetical protein
MKRGKIYFMQALFFVSYLCVSALASSLVINSSKICDLPFQQACVHDSTAIMLNHATKIKNHSDSVWIFGIKFYFNNHNFGTNQLS